jgi:hypothetical protein
LKGTDLQPCGNVGMLVMSIDSRQFTPDFIACALAQLAHRHERFLVVVADDLMIYNRYTIAQDPERLNTLFNKYWHDRYRYIQRLSEQKIIGENVFVAKYSEFCDQRFCTLWRRFSRLALSDTPLREMINKEVHNYLKKSQQQTHSSTLLYEEAQSSQAYLVDETVWALHMATNHGVTDQYYPGHMGSLLRFLYEYPNQKNLLTLLDVPPHVHGFWNISCDNGFIDYNASSWRVQVGQQGYACMIDYSDFMASSSSQRA